MVVCDDPAVYERLRMIIVHGSKVKYHHEILGVNSRLDTLQAAILTVKLRHLENWNSARRRFAARYDEMLAQTPAIVPYISPSCTHIFHQYTMRVPQRDALANHLKEKGIPHAIYYPIALHLQKAFAVSGSKKGDFPIAEQACDEVLSLPMHTELTEEQQTFIVQTIKNFYASN